MISPFKQNRPLAVKDIVKIKSTGESSGFKKLL